MRLLVLLFCFLYGLICVKSALILTSPWQFRNRKTFKTKGSISSPNLALHLPNELPETKLTLSLKMPSCDSLKSLSSRSNPRIYTPTAPIPIPQSKEPKERISKSYNLLNNFKEYSSDSSDSSIASSPEIFLMSYEPEYAKLRKEQNEERKQKRLKRKEEKLARKNEDKRNSGFYFTKEEEKDLENYSRERSQRCRNVPTNVDSPNSNLEIDSDFGSQTKGGDCYSLSF